MTSTNFNVGLTDTRSSSRVLKPPGGGHTDIFGAEPLPVKKYHGRNESSIMEGSSTNCSAPKPVETPSAPPAEAAPAPPVAVAPAQPAPTPEAAPKAAEPATAPRTQVQPSQPQQQPEPQQGRVRVPPGGYSSGLW